MSVTFSGVFVNLDSTHWTGVSSVEFEQAYVGWEINSQKHLNNVYWLKNDLKFSFSLFSKKAPFQMFDRALNTVVV